ncbi:MAG: hypothetical protein Q4D94_14590 [Bacillota bacterium]|nr:hypothetical protein [Bacillota bacterium]
MSGYSIAERMRLRREILAKIQKLMKEIAQMRELMQEFRRNGSMIGAALSRWDSQYSVYCSSDLAPDINITDSYEGITAEHFAGELPQAVGDLAAACSQMQAVQGGIQDQITRLEQYIEKLNRKVAELRAQLAAL